MRKATVREQERKRGRRLRGLSKEMRKAEIGKEIRNWADRDQAR